MVPCLAAFHHSPSQRKEPGQPPDCPRLPCGKRVSWIVAARSSYDDWRYLGCALAATRITKSDRRGIGANERGPWLIYNPRLGAANAKVLAGAHDQG
jgi:hypothetical protein